MHEGPDIARLAALAGDPARANMLLALLSVPALTSGELAAHAGVTPQTASGHLKQLESAGLLRLRCQGRHRYYSLANEMVAHFLETMLSAAGVLGFDRSRVGPKDEAMRRARTCYDHMAGAVAVKLFERMGDRAMLQWDGDVLKLTDKGIAAFELSGIILDSGAQRRRPMCLPCLDWSERRQHLAGSAGASLLKHFLDAHWVIRSGRALQITPVGEREFPKLFADS